MSVCYVVAEAGLNHNGSADRALEMVRAAAAAGCNGFKVQAYTASEFVGPDEVFTYQERDGSGGFRRITERQREMFERCALTVEAIRAVHDECLRLKMSFIVTATDPEWIDRVKRIDPRAILKVGSDDLVHEPLLRAARDSGMAVILSTGMASEDEVLSALNVVRPFALLHCVSLYPTPAAKVNLRRMLSLMKFGTAVGFSDHTEGTLAGVMAATLGAVMVEKHFTLDKNLPGPDHWFSADPAEMKSLVRGVRLSTTVRGTGDIDPGPEEVAMRATARRSVVASRALPAGVVLKRDMVAYRRPGGGLTPGQEVALLGRTTSRPLRDGEPLDPGAFFTTGEVLH